MRLLYPYFILAFDTMARFTSMWPAERIYSAAAEFVILPASGDSALSAAHPLHTDQAGRRAHQDSRQDQEGWSSSGRFLEVQPHKVTVLADTAIRANDLDESRRWRRRRRSEIWPQGFVWEHGAARAELSVALAQLERSANSATTRG
jgi:F-type H+-transporting ATPase subunit epsilon